MELLYYYLLLLFALVLHLQIPETNQKSIEEKPLNKKWWFLKNGTIYQDKSAAGLSLYPEEDPGDRILDQLLYIPKNYRKGAKSAKVHNIVFYPSWFHIYQPQDAFRNCPVSNCAISLDKSLAASADVIVFPPPDPPFEIVRPKDQLWIFYSIESPVTWNGKYQGPYDVVNWTMSYRRDSDIVISYGKWVYYDANVKELPQERNYAAGKTKQVAWFVSNCQTGNERLRYAKTIASHNISVDIYGSCGDLKCPKDEECFEMLEKRYKFYLAFENANCRDYITEKFFKNALNRTIIPIVMGANKKEYEKIAPKNSFIHVDQFSSHEALAAYLKKLDGDDDLYNTYFRWKGTGEFIVDNAYVWCRLCAMLNAPRKERHYADIHNWWSPNDICYREDTIAVKVDAFLSKMDELPQIQLIEEREAANRRQIDRNDVATPLKVLTDTQFVRIFRLSKELFWNLGIVLESCRTVATILTDQTKDTALDLETRILTALRFYASGSYQLDVLYRCISDVTDALNQPEIFDTWLKFPSIIHELNFSKLRFFEKYQVPGIIGCIHCTHVVIFPPRIDDPEYPEYVYLNRRGYHSINVQLICDSNLRIINVNAPYPGSTHDAFMWNNSNIQNDLRNFQVAGHRYSA